MLSIDILSWIALVGYHPQACLHTATRKNQKPGIALDHLLDTITSPDQNIIDQDLSHIITDMAVIAAMTSTEVTLSLSTNATIEALQEAVIQAHTVTIMTHHTVDHLLIEALLHDPETTADPDHAPPTDQVRRHRLEVHPDITKPSKIPK